jgi:diadenosine tetraphosphate (Ap4A) HIT family hydrolase
LKVAPPAPDAADGPERKSSKVEDLNESSKVEDSPEAHAKRARRKELAAAHREQVARDLPYVEAVRKMMRNLEEHSGLSDFRYVMAVHRHTGMTHVHLLLRRRRADRKTGPHSGPRYHLRVLSQLPSCTSVKSSAPHKTAHSAMVKMSMSLCWRPCERRGPGKSEKQSQSDAGGDMASSCERDGKSAQMMTPAADCQAICCSIENAIALVRGQGCSVKL